MLLNIKSLRYMSAISFICISFSIQARIQYVTIDSEGQGATVQAAINDALINAISEINGVKIAIDTKLQISESSDGKEVETNELFQQSINKKTDGLIKEYAVLNKQRSELSSELWVAMVRVTIAKFAESKQANRLRMAVIPFAINENIVGWKKPQEFQKNISKSLVNYLTQTRKFAMLDREHVNVQDNELAVLRDGGSPKEELAKLGQRLSTDYIVVGNVSEIHYHKNQKQMKVSGKTITTIKQGARVSYRVIDVATGQIKFSDSFDRVLFSSNRSVSSAKVAKKTAYEIGSVITNAIYPIRVEGIKKNTVIVGQGGITLHKGDVYTLVMLGDALQDSYTKENLGRHEKEVGTVKITQVQAKQSQAKIVKSNVDAEKLFEPGVFILRPRNTSQTAAITKKSYKKKEKAAKKSVDEFEKSLSSDW